MYNQNENAADRFSYAGEIFSLGEQTLKSELLDKMPGKWSELHRKGYIHIHDLDAYGLTYNCLALDIVRDFPFSKYYQANDIERINGVFGYITRLIESLGNEQSGGMAFANFDNDLAFIFSTLGVSLNDVNKTVLSSAIKEFIIWCNETHTRLGKTSYYVTLNLGLANNGLARYIAETVLDRFANCGDTVYKPNIVFKVSEKVNMDADSPNYYLFEKALLCTAKKMIPTYLLCDSKINCATCPEDLSVMGCRTRVVDDIYGKSGSVGRGNIANITINLPRLAMETVEEEKELSVEEKLIRFQKKWDDVASVVKEILLDRYAKVCRYGKEKFTVNVGHRLWCEDFKEDLNLVFRHGTLSIGFIGLSEAMEVLTGKKFYNDIKTMIESVCFVQHMRDYCDFLRNEYNMNFSLLATSGELISGRFVEIDRKDFDYKRIFDKGFYTNSFHFDVDSGVTGFKKIQGEGIFHQYCNGGSITYVELKEAPIGNAEGLEEYVRYAVNSNVNYLGFNFPKDICKDCGASGVFDVCSECGSKNIIRIRRVSGYLEVLDGFTKGKKCEVKTRRAN